MKILFLSLILITVFKSPFAFSLDKQNCFESSDFLAKIADFKRNLLEPNYNKNCKKENVPKECTNYVEQLETQKKDWRSYLKTCEQENTKLKYAGSCLKGIEELINFLTENAAQQALINSENKECSTKTNNKMALLEAYNSNMPELLKYKNQAAVKSLLKKSCLEIKNFLISYQKNLMQKLTLTLPQPNSEFPLTSAQTEYLNWRERFTQPYKIGEPFWEEMTTLLKDKVQNSRCMSSYRLSEASCRLATTLISSIANTRLVLHILDEAKLAKLVERELAKELSYNPTPLIDNQKQLIIKINRIQKELNQ